MRNPRASPPNIVPVLVAISTGAAAVGCTLPDAGKTATAALAPRSDRAWPAAAAAGAAPPFDLGAVARQAHFAFRPAPDGSGFTGGHSTYQVSASSHGAVTMSARRVLAGAAPQVAVAPPIAVETVAVSVTSPGAPAAARSWSPRAETTGDGGLVIDRGAVRERLRGSDAGIEQTWEVARRPAGTGDLLIRVRVGGLPFIGPTGGGLHFADGATGLGVRYGNATWVAADGSRTRVAATFARGEITFRVPRAVLDGSRYPAVLDPFLTPEFGMDNPVLGEGLSSYAAVAAFDGSNYLVVWQDGRQTPRSASSHIYGARVSATGAVLDPLGFPIGTTTELQQLPAIAYAGGIYLVAWQQGAYGKTYVSRVGTDGTVLDPAGLATGVSGDEVNPAVASDGSNFLVVWAAGSGSGGTIYATRLTPTGAVLGTKGVVVSDNATSGSQTENAPAVAFDGANYLVVWQDDRNGSWDIYGNRVSAGGEVLDGAGWPIASDANAEEAPSLAWGGASYLVVWTEYVDTTTRDSSIVARRVSPDGTLVDASALVLCAAAGEQRDATVAFDGDAYLVAWTDERVATDADIFAARVGKDGTIANAGGDVIMSAPSAQYGPRLVFGAGQYLMTWSDARSGRGIAYAARLAPGGASVDGTGFPLAGVPNMQDTPAVAFAGAGGGDQYLALWADARTGGPSLYGTRISRRGAAIDRSGIRVAPGLGAQMNPLLAWNGSSYLVVWSAAEAFARRVAADGSAIDSADIALPGMVTYDMASNGSDFLVVGAPLSGGDISALRISGSGAVLDAAPLVVSAAAGSQNTPRVAFDGTSYVVVWTDYRAGAQSHPYAARVSPAGVVLDPDGILLTTSTGTDYQSTPAVASDGTGSFAIWEDTGGTSLRGTRLGADGQVLDATGVVVVTAPSYGVLDEPRIVFNGTNYVVAWEVHQYSSSAQFLGQVLNVTRVSPAGLPLGGGFTIATHPTEAVVASLASDRAGGVLVTYVLPESLGALPIPRVKARLYFETMPAGACNVTGDCASSFCVDGVCCDSACGGGVAGDCIACSVAAGAATDGTCGPVGDGHDCSDGNACTLTDRCLAGVCVGSDPFQCPGDGGADAQTDAGDTAAAADARDAGTTDADDDAGATTRDSSGGADATPDARDARDASVDRAETDAATPGPPPPRSGCGCDLGGRSRSPVASILLLLVVTATLVRRRRA